MGLHYPSFISLTLSFNKIFEDWYNTLKVLLLFFPALLRRGTARKSLKEFVAAKEDLEAVLKAEPNNKQAKVKVKLS